MVQCDERQLGRRLTRRNKALMHIVTQSTTHSRCAEVSGVIWELVIVETNQRAVLMVRPCLCVVKSRIENHIRRHLLPPNHLKGIRKHMLPCLNLQQLMYDSRRYISDPLCLSTVVKWWISALLHATRYVRVKRFEPISFGGL